MTGAVASQLNFSLGARASTTMAPSPAVGDPVGTRRGRGIESERLGRKDARDLLMRIEVALDALGQLLDIRKHWFVLRVWCVPRQCSVFSPSTGSLHSCSSVEVSQTQMFSSRFCITAGYVEPLVETDQPHQQRSCSSFLPKETGARLLSWRVVRLEHHG